MQELWATATVHHHLTRFKMNNKKRIMNLEYFIEMLQICPRIPNQQFDELPFEEEILEFLRQLGHSGEIKMIIDVNINKLHQPWRSFVAVTNKCLSGKSIGYDSIQRPKLIDLKTVIDGWLRLKGNAFIDDPIAHSFDDLLNSSDHPPQHQTHSFESYNDNLNYGYPPQEPFVYNQDSCYEQNFVDNSQSPPQPQYETYSFIHHPPQETSVEILQARENLVQSIQTFLKKFNRISFRETPKVLTRAWDNFFEIQHAQPEDIHELLCKLLEDLQIINEELAEYNNSLSRSHPAFYNDDDEYSNQYKKYLENSSNAITPILPTEDPDNSLSMGDEHLSTILETESDEVIKSSVENLVLIPSESKGIFDDTCDVPFYDNSPLLVVLTDHFKLFFDFNDDCTSSDDDYFEDIDYVQASPPNSELVGLEEVQDDILHEKLLNINLLIAKIESLNDNSTPDCMLNDHTEETSSGSTTTHANNSLPEYDSFLYEIEPDQGELTSVVIEDILGEPHVHMPNVLPTHPTHLLHSDFILSDDSHGSGLEVFFPSGTRNKIFDPGIFLEVQSKKFLSRDTFFISFIRNPLCPLSETLLPFSSKNEDKVFNPGILSSNRLSHRDKITFDFSKSPMMISGRDIPSLDVLFLHFYPP
nr:hypothetical protein [Tanacetum cinerariifolium]